MAALCILMLYFNIFTLLSQEIPVTANTLTPSQSIIDGQTLLSQGGTFELGFFSPSNSKNRYLGIWYKTIPTQTVVWVANRDSPLNDTSGILKIGSSSNLVIVNQSESVFWSTNSSRTVENPVVEFLESGNLILRDSQDGNSENYLWQSFDHPSDTLLPGMKLGWNLKTGVNRFLTSWRNFDDPSQGDYTCGIDYTPYIESSVRNMSNKYYRSGPWNGLRWSGAPDMKPNTIFRYEIMQMAEESYYIFHLVNQSVIMRFLLSQTGTEGTFQRLTWVDKTNSWVRLVSIPRDRCDDYALCGVYSSCDATNVAVCQCLKGFKPKSPQDWSETDWSQGCERVAPVNCSKGEGFVKYTGLKLPDTTNSWLNSSMNLEECRVKCLNNCSCMAYTNSNIRGDGSGCVMWFKDLIDMRQLTGAGQDLYIRMAASELTSKSNSRRERVIMIICIAFAAGMIVLSLGTWCLWKKRRPRGECEKDNLEMPLFDLSTIATATNNFSEDKKLGEGGFGPVYKVQVYMDLKDFKLMGKKHALLICNHKSDIDWLVGWVLAQRSGCLGSALAVMKKQLKFLLVIGWSMWFSEYVFLEKSWAKDENTLKARRQSRVLDEVSHVPPSTRCLLKNFRK